MMKRTIIVWGVLLLVLVLAGCGSTASAAPPPTSTPGARATACQTLATIDEHLKTLAQVGEQTTVGEVKSLQKKIAVSLPALDKLIPGEMGPAMSSLQAANNQLGASIQDEPNQATIGQTSGQLQWIKEQVAKAQAAATKLASGLKCP
jgi:hypothetical protein